jgi:hypothetical protein
MLALVMLMVLKHRQDVVVGNWVSVGVGSWREYMEGVGGMTFVSLGIVRFWDVLVVFVFWIWWVFALSSGEFGGGDDFKVL